MFRKSLPYDRGMLFSFDTPMVLNFWGRNTYINLDIAFLDENLRIVKIDHIDMLSDKSVSSVFECRLALEVNSGYFKQNGIDEGDYIDISLIARDYARVSFRNSRKRGDIDEQ